LHYAEVRCQRSERVIRDLGRRCGNRRQQRRLACIRLSNKPDIGDELQLERDATFLPLSTWFPMSWRTIGGCGECLVAATTAATFRDGELLVVFEKLTDHVIRIGIFHDCADRHAQYQVFAIAARSAFSLAVFATLSAVVLLITVIEQRRQLSIGA